MEPRLIGYLWKRPTPRPSWLEVECVTEIASVSACVAARPDGWIDRWKHNDWFVYDSPELAREVAVWCGAYDWPVMAYRVLPVRFDPEGDVPIEVDSEAAPMPSVYERLGWDVASKSLSPEFECSPLSCNGMAAEVAVNAVCLLDSLEDAVAFARRCAREQPEPGSYFVVEVWRST